ncbi:MAG: hypothetical protein LBT71_03465 [Azoarcus sp.]|jgi:hypothetical protein|nr:hypothetical protein [Azoarcus sp.]
MPLIASSIPGRIRIRHKSLTDAGRGERLRAAFLAFDGIVRVDVSPAASSLIVHYDAAAIPAETMEAVADEIVAAELRAMRSEHKRGLGMNRYAKYGMLLSLAATFALAARGKRRAHALSGCFFAACLGAHLYFHRSRMMH